MTTAAESVPKHDPLAADISSAGLSIRLNDWDRYVPLRPPVVPHIRIGKRWINVLWALPIAALALIILIAVAQSLREIPAVEAFIQRYPGVAEGQPPVVGFPGWLRVQHYLNMFFMYFIMRPVSRFSPITRGFIGIATAPQERSGSGSRIPYRRIEFGPPRTTPSRCPAGLASRVYAIPSGSHADGTSRSTCCGPSTASPFSSCCS